MSQQFAWDFSNGKLLYLGIKFCLHVFLWVTLLLAKTLLSKSMTTFTGELMILSGFYFYFQLSSSSNFFFKIWPNVGFLGLTCPGIWFFLLICSFKLSFFFRKVSLNYILVFVLFYCAGFLFWEFVYIESVFFVFICIFFFFLITLWWFYLFIAF